MINVMKKSNQGTGWRVMGLFVIGWSGKASKEVTCG